MSLPSSPQSTAQELVSTRRKHWLRIGTAVIGLLILTIVVAVLLKPSPKVLIGPMEVQRSELTLIDGRLFLIGESNSFMGVLIEKYDDGSLKSRSMVADGKLNGISEGWHTNRQMAVREIFYEGVSHGQRLKWYPTGTNLSEANIVEGQIHGTFKRWHENGVLAEQIEMVQGQPDGISRAYFPSGYLKAEANMRMGQVLKQEFWKDGEKKVGDGLMVPEN